jgi:phosphotransferase system HPr-like phosphotransfer protein
MLFKTEVQFRNIDDIRSFVKSISELDADVNINNGRTTIDGKSLVGACSLDISRPCELEVISSEDISSKVTGIINSIGIGTE